MSDLPVNLETSTSLPTVRQLLQLWSKEIQQVLVAEQKVTIQDVYTAFGIGSPSSMKPFLDNACWLCL